MDKSVLPPALQAYAPFIQNLAVAVAVTVVGWIFSKWAAALAARGLKKRNVDEALARFLGSIAQYVVLAATLITALQSAGFETTSFVALLGSAGLAIGLALQGSLSNFAAGVMILFFRPFRLDEAVSVAGQTGKVVDIGIFATTLHAFDGETVIVANSAITSGTIINYTIRGARRGKIEVGVGYESNIPKVMEILTKATKESPLVLEDPAPGVAFVSFGASSLDFLVLPQAKPEDFVDMLHDVKVRIFHALQAEGIEIPFNQLVIHKSK